MGGPMAANLIKAGHQVTAFDFVQAALDTFVEAGGIAASSAMDAIKDAQVVVSMLPAGKHVAGLYLGSEGLLANLTKGSLVIDSSTIDVETARRVGVEAKKLGIHFVDAPVSGGTAGAKAGTLSFIVGGDQTCFERAQPVLEAMGKNIFHAGTKAPDKLPKCVITCS